MEDGRQSDGFMWSEQKSHVNGTADYSEEEKIIFSVILFLVIISCVLEQTNHTFLGIFRCFRTRCDYIGLSFFIGSLGNIISEHINI